MDEPQYLLMLNDTILIDCCAARRVRLELEYDVKQLTRAENLVVPFRHCGLGCVNTERRKDEK